ncbi:hypothetical protein GCM10009422_04380 [Brevundimonas kwangchunensis]|uniref:Uncharacterized protein n=1 Tax=Brevundimonas kwangchunensis TaxID=322163 RepID=A0ABN1GJ03_9CAUL
MTQSPSLHALQPLGPGPHYVDQHIWLPQLFAEHAQAGQPFIDGKTFERCRFEGPAVLLPLAGTTFDACNMGEASGDIRNLLLAPVGESKVVGVIPVRNCAFRDCAFYMVGFTGTTEFLKQFRQMVGLPDAPSANGGEA